MADVDRGQLILMTGLVIAVGFAALALLMNMAIFTENLGSRGADTGAVDALEFRQVSIETVRDLMGAENRQNRTSREALFRNVSNGVETFDTISSTRNARGSTIADLSAIQLHNGTVLAQNRSDRDFVSNGSSPANNWTLATGVTDARGYVVEVTDLNSTTDPGTEAFRITLDDGTDQWSLYLYNESGESRLAVRNGSGGFSEDVCDAVVPGGPPFEVNLTGGTVDGSPCSAIDFGKGVTTPYTLEYQWGNRSEGTYQVTVNSTSGIANFDHFRTGQPYHRPVIYSASFDVIYRTDQVAYRDRVRVTPGGSG